VPDHWGHGDIAVIDTELGAFYRQSKGVRGDHDPGAVVLLERAHRTQPRFEAAVVALGRG
jgi:hypothetical protein